MSKTVPFQTILFSLSTQFKYEYTVYLSEKFTFQTIQFNISTQLVLLKPEIGLYQVLPFRARAELEAMAMKGYST